MVDVINFLGSDFVGQFYGVLYFLLKLKPQHEITEQSIIRGRSNQPEFVK